MDYKIIIAGGRLFDDYPFLENSMYEVLYKKLNLNSIDDSVTIISGRAKGADSLGEIFAVENDFKLKIYPADWNSYGKKAGYIRNRQMAIEGEANVLCAFWDGESKGTKHMIDIMKERQEKFPSKNIKIFVYRY